MNLHRDLLLATIGLACCRSSGQNNVRRQCGVAAAAAAERGAARVGRNKQNCRANQSSASASASHWDERAKMLLGAREAHCQASR